MLKWRFRRGGTANSVRSRRLGRLARHGNPLATMIFRKKPGGLPDFSSKLVQAIGGQLK
jgi:hypothetical protein